MSSALPIVESAYASALLTTSLLSSHPTIRHGITGRIPGHNPAEGNVGYSTPRDPEAAWIERQHWSRAAGIDPSALSLAHQIHGNDVIVVGRDRLGEPGPLGRRSLGKADGLITATSGIAVMTLHADCLPIILADVSGPVVAVVHAGWRGTVVDVVGATINAMVAECGANRDQIVAMLGPGIRSCCYEVGDEVVAAWREMGGEDADRALTMGPRRWHLDLALANSILIARAEIRPEHIDDQAYCTQCHADRWFSHRAQGPATGRFAAIAGIAPEDRKDGTSWF
jgi:YfiH family protein